MYYPNNINYMEDLYYYNQTPNTYMQQAPIVPNNQYIPNPYYQVPVQNAPSLTSYYPSIYRIMNPVIQRVVSNNSNMPMPNEDQINNMVDTVYNIIEGQLPKEQYETREENSIHSNQNANTSSLNQNQGQNPVQRQDTKSSSNLSNERNINNSNENLFRDIIKILIIKELISKFQNPRMQCPIQNYQPGFNGMSY